MQLKTCFSGGAQGHDALWEAICAEYGITTFSLSFSGHKCYGAKPVKLTEAQLDTYSYYYVRARIWLSFRGKHVCAHDAYVKKLLLRDAATAYASKAVFAIAPMLDKYVAGGTGWTVAFAILMQKPVYVLSGCWHTYSYAKQRFLKCDEPLLVDEFAGVGTRAVEDEQASRRAIRALLEAASHV